MYARPTIEDEPLRFGVSGKLWREVLVLYDRQTRSLWSQRTGQAIAGPLSGSEFEVLPSVIVEWGSWREHHGDSTVLVIPEGSDFGSSVAGVRVPELALLALLALLSTTLLLIFVRRRSLR